MRVTLCVDALQPQLTGIGRYTWELCKGLRQCRGIAQLDFYAGHALVDQPARLLREEFRPLNRDRGPRRWLRKWQLGKAMRSSLVHGPNYFLPLAAEAGVITVHDLSVFRYPEAHPVERVRAFERLFASSISRAAHVITDTETVRREILDTFSLPSGSVSAVPLGASNDFRAREEPEIAGAIAQWRLTPGRYGLSVAAFEPRKKLAELIAAWERLPPRVRDSYPLVLAGASGWHNDDLHLKIRRGVSEGWLKHLGFVDEHVLPYLYAGARLFVYPSIYEGFGLPPVEAMAAGTPVLTSNRSCLPEVCGNAARFIDPDDLEEFTACIEECLIDGEWRSEAIVRGFERARHFTWDRCLEGTLAVYQAAQGGRS